MAIDSPESKSEILKLAKEYLENDSPGKAIKLLENTEISESDTELQHLLASAYADRKWGKKAAAQYRKCLSGKNVYPELIQDYAEFMLDSEEHAELTAALYELLDKESIYSDRSLTAVCIAMLYAVLGDCIAGKKETELTDEILKNYLEKRPEAADKKLFTEIMERLSLTPNELTIAPVAEKLIRTMAGAVPSVLNENGFQKAAADFEISLILFANMVDPLTVLALRTAKLKFASPSDDTDNLKYLVFDAKMTVVETLRTKKLDTERFQKTFPYLWSLISKFITGASRTSDLKKFTRDEIYSELKNASPRLIKIFENNLSADGFAALKGFLASPASVPRPALFNGGKKVNRPVVSRKISPNAPCPCGSGKKYKKCCGLK